MWISLCTGGRLQVHVIKKKKSAWRSVIHPEDNDLCVFVFSLPSCGRAARVERE